MGGPEDAFTKESMKQAFIRNLTRFFSSVRDAKSQMMILGFLDNLNSAIFAGFAQQFTQSKGFEKEEMFKLAMQLDFEKSSDARTKILLDALADKDKCGLEEEFLEKLRES